LDYFENIRSTQSTERKNDADYLYENRGDWLS